MRSEKWPREYANEIVDLKTKEEMIKAMTLVPDKYKKLTACHVNSIRRKRRVRDEARKLA